MALKKLLMVGVGILVSLVTFFTSRDSFGFLFDSKKEKLIFESAFWRVVHFQNHQANVGTDHFYRLYSKTDGAGKPSEPQLIVIKPPLVERETSEFHAVIHPNSLDSFYSQCMVIVVERFKNERGYSDERMKTFWVRNAKDIRPQ
jgi:hypothetical protein